MRFVCYENDWPAHKGSAAAHLQDMPGESVRDDLAHPVGGWEKLKGDAKNSYV
jgi:hypothetical protein